MPRFYNFIKLKPLSDKAVSPVTETKISAKPQLKDEKKESGKK